MTGGVRLGPDVVAEGPVYILHSTLILAADLYDGNAAPPAEDAISAGRGVVQAYSAWETHYAQVRLELWASEPPAQSAGIGGDWEIVTEAVLPMAEPGDLIASTPTCGPTGTAADVAIHLPKAGNYGVRAYSRGREEVVRIHLATQQTYADHQVAAPGEGFRGIEQYLFQLWAQPGDR